MIYSYYLKIVYNGKVVGYLTKMVRIGDCLEGDFNLEDIDATG